MQPNSDPAKINELLTRGVEKIYPSKEEFEKLLLSGKRIRVYCGYDPSSSRLHIGSSITMRKLGLFQELGHEVILLIGDFTGMIGDPTDKTATRRKLTREEVNANAKNYKKYASKFLKFSGENPAQLKKNSKWSDKLSFLDLIEISSNLTVQQLIARDMFQERLRAGRPIHLHEFLYPLAQGYDSVAMEVDAEIGGNDQTFNMLVGRDLMKVMKGKEKFVLTVKLLADPEGKKMGKSEGNAVNMDEAPKEMFGKIMSWPDEIIIPAFELLTDAPLEWVKELSGRMQAGSLNPKDAKTELAKTIVSFYHSKSAAQKAARDFKKIFTSDEIPAGIPEVEISENEMGILDLLIKTTLAASRSEARRLIEQKGVEIDNELQLDWQKTIPLKKGMVIQVGKRKFAKVK